MSRRLWIPISILGVAAFVVAGGIIVKFIFKDQKQTTLSSANIKVPIRMVDKEVINHDTYIYTFALPSSEHLLGLPIGNNVKLHARIHGETIVRAYTPISLSTEEGYVKFLIKTYRKNVLPDHPNGGKLTQYLETLSKDSCVEISGPFGNVTYLGRGNFEMGDSTPIKMKVERISFICGGPGLARVFQLILSILADKDDATHMALLYVNQTESDILLRDQLEEFRDNNSERFSLWYALWTPTHNWPYTSCPIERGVLADHLFPGGDKTIAILCDPEQLIGTSLMSYLETLSYNSKSCFNL